MIGPFLYGHAKIDAARQAVSALDWKMQDVVASLPDEVERSI